MCASRRIAARVGFSTLFREVGSGPTDNKMNSETGAALRELLRKFGSNTYHIEYNDFFSSHVLHALVALHRLGASESRLREHANLHATWLEPAKSIDSSRRIQNDEWRAGLGLRTNYREFSEYFLEKIALSSAREAVGPICPGYVRRRLVCGRFSSAHTHRIWYPR